MNCSMRFGALPEYSLAQIRDRYSTLPLGLAHLPSLVERRLIERLDEPRLETVCRATFEELSRALPELDFGAKEWSRLYPFTPGAIALLEGVAGRFLSRTRSAASFCAREVEAFLRAEAPAEQRIGSDELWEYARPEFEEHADLKALDGAWDAWCELLPDITPNPATRPLLERLMRGLLLFKVAGRAPTVAALCHATAFESGLEGEANYLYARGLLEALRTRGPFVAVERGETPAGDRYAVDLGTRAGEMARRMTLNLRRDLVDNDPRTRDFVRRCSTAYGLPLGGDGAREVFWRNVPRSVALVVWDGHATLSALNNRVGALREPGTPEDALLVLCPPLGDGEAARRAWEEACRQAPDELTRAALVLWLPRPAATDELDAAREATAAHLLEADPALSDNRRGRSILSHLREGAAARDAQSAHLAVRLLREGEIFTGAGTYADAGELLSGDNATDWLESLVSFALPHAFPRWEAVAPRARVLTASVCDALCLEILRRPLDAPFYAPAHERAVRAVCEPLGLARAVEGRWRIEPGSDELRALVRDLVGEGITLSLLAAQLAKSVWGLTREQSSLLVCGMVRCGEVLGVDARNEALLPATLGMPLARSVRSLRVGRVLAGAEWDQVRRISEALDLPLLPPTPTFAAQEAAQLALVRWREDVVGETELASARLSQLKRALGGATIPTEAENASAKQASEETIARDDWGEVEAARAAVEALLRALAEPLPAASALQRAIVTFDAPRYEALARWREVCTALEARHGLLLRAVTLLRHPLLSAPPELADARDTLLLRLTVGAPVLRDETLTDDFAAWQRAYQDTYLRWHSAQHDVGRFLSVRRLASSDAMRALERLETLAARPFGAGAEVREILRDESGKACAHSGDLRPDAPVCESCRLRWGERLALRDTRDIEALMAEGFAALRRALEEPAVESTLQRHHDGQMLLEWRDQATAPIESGRELLPLLNEDGRALLERAFAPQREVTLNATQLTDTLRTCETRGECERVFARWLSAQNLGGDDRIIWE